MASSYGSALTTSDAREEREFPLKVAGTPCVPYVRLSGLKAAGGEIVIEANASDPKTLAGQLLTLAQDGTPDGAHLHLEENNGLEEGSVSLVLERYDDE
jgi:hypothetical protein